MKETENFPCIFSNENPKMKSYLCSFLKGCCFAPCSRAIIEHVAFQPPPPTYLVTQDAADEKYTFQIISNDENYKLMQHTLPQKDLEFSFVTTKISQRVACLYYRVKPATQTTILYSHGNASDLGSTIIVCMWLAKNLKCNVLAYDYSGYGLSSGKPSEKQIYADVEAAYKLLEERYNCLPEDVILFGQSLGSAPTLHLASKVQVRGVVVQSGFASALNVGFPTERPTKRCCDVFTNIGAVSKVNSPVLVIHGTEDKMIDLSHGRAIFERSPLAVEPLWVEGGRHDDLELRPEYLHRLKRFVLDELPDMYRASVASAAI